MTLTPERIADLVKRLNQMAVDLSNCDTLPRQHRDTQYEIDAAIVLCREAADALEAKPIAGVEGLDTALEKWRKRDDEDDPAWPMDRDLEEVWQQGVSWALLRVGKFLGIKNWDADGASESVEGDVDHEIWSIFATAKLYDPEDGSWATLAKPTPIAAPDQAELIKWLQNYADDPMWADNAEIPKILLKGAIAMIRRLAALSRVRPTSTERDVVGTYTCPICGLDKPHHHPDEQVLAYREDQIRRDGWTSAAHRQPKESGWYLCFGVEVNPDQYGKKKDFWTANERWSQLSWFIWVREAGSHGVAECEIPEVLYFDRNSGWKLRTFLGNAIVSGAESRFPVYAKPKYWRDLLSQSPPPRMVEEKEMIALACQFSEEAGLTADGEEAMLRFGRALQERIKT